MATHRYGAIFVEQENEAQKLSEYFKVMVPTEMQSAGSGHLISDAQS